MQATTVYPTAHLSHYGVDGTGRDCYINFDNGGMHRGFNLHGQQKFSRGSFDRPVHYKKPIIAVTGMPLHYPNDGTGRDTYIIVNEGGFGLAESRKRRNYINSLRCYSQRDSLPKADIFMSSQHTVSPFSRPRLQLLNTTQSQLSTRLSEPKIKEDPYKEMRDSFRKSMGRGSLTTRAASSREMLSKTPF